MMRLRTYAVLSFGVAIAVIYHAFSSRGQFYPAMVYLSTSKISLVLLLNMSLVVMCTLWQFVKTLFLGSLREAEVERLNEQSLREVMEILFAITIFRQDFSVTFLAMVTTLLLIKALHWLAQKRVEYIETTPSVPTMSHLRIISFLGFLLVLDCLFLYNSVNYLIQTRQPSVSLFFSFEYMILATTTVSTFVKYVFYISDMLMEGQWERKAVYTFYLELVRDLLHLSMYLFFFLVIFIHYGVPLHLIRELYETFRNFKARITDYVRYRKITSNMNERFPDATAEELNASDVTCIICREEMITAKKLLCGHLFHVHCLRSWLERQHTCPTCRALVVPPENGTSAAGIQAERNQPGSGMGSTSTQISGENMLDDNMSQHQARLRAAAAAAALYEKSYVYSYANAIVWSQGYALSPQVPTMSTNEGDSDSAVLASTSSQAMHHPLLPSTAYPNFVCSHVSQGSQLEAQERFVQRQFEVLQSQLQFLKQQKLEASGVASTCDTEKSDVKDKAVAASSDTSSASVRDCGRHSEIEEVDAD